MALFSVGHSNVATEVFMALLRQHQMEVLVDVRSAPYSRYNPQFNREPLQRVSLENGLSYIYLGDKIGGMPKDPSVMTPTGSVDFDLIEATLTYQTGISQLALLGATQRVAFMCAEADYHHCHRFHLITRSLLKRGVAVQHLLPTGALQLARLTDYQPCQQALF